jgi:hypothetical protein
MSLLDLSALDAAPLERDPFDFLVVPDCIRPEAREGLVRDYPQITLPRNFALDEVRFGPAFQTLVEELNAPGFARRLGAKFGVDLDSADTTITVRRYCELSDGNIHTDHWSKIITVLIYFNREWHHEAGKLRMLRSADDIEDYAAEVTPLGGTLLAFRRSDHSYHGHKRFEGERLMLQMNWIRPNRLARYVQRLDRFSTHLMKRLSRMAHQDRPRG